MNNELRYRANVAGILRNGAGRILVCERIGVPGAWQFPQGSVDEGETDEQALVRELWEEVGLRGDRYRIVEQRGPYQYEYANGKVKKGCHGKIQQYFLCDFHGTDDEIVVATEHPEFGAYQWIAPAEFRLEWLPEMKRAVYTRVLDDFFGVKLSPGHESC